MEIKDRTTTRPHCLQKTKSMRRVTSFCAVRIHFDLVITLFCLWYRSKLSYKFKETFSLFIAVQSTNIIVLHFFGRIDQSMYFTLWYVNNSWIKFFIHLYLILLKNSECYQVIKNCVHLYCKILSHFLDDTWSRK